MCQFPSWLRSNERSNTINHMSESGNTCVSYLQGCEAMIAVTHVTGGEAMKAL